MVPSMPTSHRLTPLYLTSSNRGCRKRGSPALKYALASSAAAAGGAGSTALSSRGSARTERRVNGGCCKPRTTVARLAALAVGWLGISSAVQGDSCSASMWSEVNIVVNGSESEDRLDSGGPEGDGEGLSSVTYWPNK